MSKESFILFNGNEERERRGLKFQARMVVVRAWNFQGELLEAIFYIGEAFDGNLKLTEHENHASFKYGQILNYFSFVSYRCNNYFRNIG